MTHRDRRPSGYRVALALAYITLWGMVMIAGAFTDIPFVSRDMRWVFFLSTLLLAASIVTLVMGWIALGRVERDQESSKAE